MVKEKSPTQTQETIVEGVTSDEKNTKCELRSKNPDTVVDSVTNNEKDSKCELKSKDCATVVDGVASDDKDLKCELQSKNSETVVDDVNSDEKDLKCELEIKKCETVVDGVTSNEKDLKCEHESKNPETVVDGVTSDNKDSKDKLQNKNPETNVDGASCDEKDLKSEIKSKNPKTVVDSISHNVKDSKCELEAAAVDSKTKTNGTESTNITKATEISKSELSKESDKVAGSAEESEKKVEEKYHESPTKNEAYILLAQGKRHYLVKDYSSAVSTLGDCCAKFSEIFGEMADECGDVYFSYGKALLELAREESGVLGPAIEKEKEDESDDEEDADAEEGDTEKNEPQENEDIEMKENGTVFKKVNGESSECEKDATEGEDVGKDAEEEEEDVNNLQLAWEMLELSKVIYERQKSEEKLADTLSKLGEVSLETENYEQAIEDMSKSLDLQQKILKADNRGVAETYFQLGVACSLANFHDRSISYFKQAKEVLELRIKNLKNKTEPDVEDKVNAFYTIEGEIKEIEAILPEIDEKITDMEDFKAETLKALTSKIIPNIPKEGESSSTSTSTSTEAPAHLTESVKPATDISHLIRKKRKPEESAEGSACKVKRVATEAGENGKNEVETNGDKISIDTETKEVESKSA